ncbi:2432_t:CDS:2 [Funneliformis geosporum]|uniref:10260_t:CDS:1 n=1 Tax=Funneliformis geosporum TaxID=1117311 RepID=A0A9W4WYJ5_9GLOM|nr:2432_t:CDS:2 [Funneliformis geosporum]CAI2188739.1 10260_t:CDS:2 [Funneliformis geosporum]
MLPNETYAMRRECYRIIPEEYVAVPFVDFLPLIKEVTDAFNEMIKIYQEAEHNKIICGKLLDKVQKSDTAISNLKNRNENDEYFSRENFNKLKSLVHIIGNIRNFVGKIAKSYQDERIENDVKIFNYELDFMMQSMDISLASDTGN